MRNVEARRVWKEKKVVAIKLSALPPCLPEIFKRLTKAGSSASALFGGAVRDADLEALWGVSRPIKDYDLRCWLPPSVSRDSEWEARFGLALMAAFEGSSMMMKPSAGTGRLRHVLTWRGIELDISARPRPNAASTSAEVACERALDADASLSAVSIDQELNAWCEELYAVDRQERRITDRKSVV